MGKLIVGLVRILPLCVAHWCCGDPHKQAPLVATRAAARPDATTRGHLHPPLDLAPDEIGIHAVPTPQRHAWWQRLSWRVPTPTTPRPQWCRRASPFV
jgi:hypothetical protein